MRPFTVVALLFGLIWVPGLIAQARISGHVTIIHPPRSKVDKDDSGAVISLVPLNGTAAGSEPPRHFRLAQKNKSFEKHLLVISAGSIVDFPNFDPIFHNVFSLFNGQRFDLGLYESGTTRSVKFAKPGVSYIFCNIHPQMEAVVVTVPTPWFAVTRADGDFTINNVPPGRYEMQVWFERASAEELSALTRTIAVESDVELPEFTVHSVNVVPAQHKNKYGRDYDVSSPDSPYTPGQ